jgi:hypothetical protein
MSEPLSNRYAIGEKYAFRPVSRRISPTRQTQMENSAAEIQSGKKCSGWLAWTEKAFSYRKVS